MGGFTVRQDQSIQNRLVHGMYKPQISSYARKFPRSHILIMDFDRLLNNQEKYIKKMVEFYGLPYSEHKHKLKELPAENEKLFGGKVKTVACSTRRRLDNIWYHYNVDLFDYLKETHSSAPYQEPEFDWSNHFITQASCETEGEVIYVSDESGSGNFTTTTVLVDDED